MLASAFDGRWPALIAGDGGHTGPLPEADSAFGEQLGSGELGSFDLASLDIDFGGLEGPGSAFDAIDASVASDGQVALPATRAAGGQG